MFKFLFKKKKKKIHVEDIESKITEIVKEIPIIKELPPLSSIKDIRNFSVKYILIKGFAYAHIYWDPSLEILKYDVIEPNLNEDEKEIYKTVKEKLFEKADIDILDKDRVDRIKYIFNSVKKILDELKIRIEDISFYKIFYYIFRDTVGLGKIEPLMHDPYIEDISCDGVGIPVYICHRKYGNLRTNIVFENEAELQSFIIKLSQLAEKYISYAEPYLDGILPDGSRVNATFSKDITTRGPTFTIRKFKRIPYTPLDLIRLKTLDFRSAAYLWWVIEHKANILIGGETSSGKTTLLNAICMFIPYDSKIISIEDTRELQLYHENWIPSVTREGYGPPDSYGRRYGEVNMFDLLKESFRQNPDYIVVGEVRGKEAYVLFQGMASGHCCLSTIHADSFHSVIRRLSAPPINLSPELIENLDILIFMVHAREKGAAARRIKEIVEIAGISPKTSSIEINKSFIWIPIEDTLKESSTKVIFHRLSEKRGFYLGDIEEDLKEREIYLKWLYRKGIKDPLEFSKKIKEFQINREKIIEEIKNEVKE